MGSNSIEIVKAHGEREAFDREKLKRSLERAGATQDLAEDIATRIEKRIKNGMTTKDIYRQAFSVLRKIEMPLATRFNLKRAIFQFGPAGYPFEKFVGKLLERRGYKVQVGKIVPGKCVRHEIDVIAEKEDQHFLVECKFHNQQGIKSDVKVALYVKARFDDVQAGLREEYQHPFHQAWLVTNTKFSKDAIQYARCQGMRIIGWNYPRGGSLQVFIEEAGLHPLTCLLSLPLFQKRMLLNRGVVLCRELIENPSLLSEVGVKGAKQEQVIDEIRKACS
jgi:hypothetical protein